MLDGVSQWGFNLLELSRGGLDLELVRQGVGRQGRIRTGDVVLEEES